MADTVNFGIPNPLNEGNGPKEVGYEANPLTEVYNTNPLNEGNSPKEVGYETEGSGL